MFATKTRPSARIEIESTTPVTTVRISSRPGSGPYAGWATRERGNPGARGAWGAGGPAWAGVLSLVLVIVTSRV